MANDLSVLDDKLDLFDAPSTLDDAAVQGRFGRHAQPHFFRAQILVGLRERRHLTTIIRQT